jgi:SPP1 gp7 family putative phage head morphogenesis protein
MAQSSAKLEDVNAFTRDSVSGSLREGLESGEGLPQLTTRIENLLGSNRARAQRIARTQTASAVSTGRHEGMKSAGVEFKAWITSQDDAVRPSHRQAGSDYADGIPIDQPFVVDGEALAYPGDPSGSAANIINCRCLQVARLNRAAAAPTEFLQYKSPEDPQ